MPNKLFLFFFSIFLKDARLCIVAFCVERGDDGGGRATQILTYLYGKYLWANCNWVSQRWWFEKKKSTYLMGAT